jgi:fructose-bisphosphate aldolase class II
MPLTSIAPYLTRARREGFAIPLFDAFDMFSAEGFFLAAEAKQAPVIVALYSGVMNRPSTPSLVAYIQERARRSSLPVSLMLDHGSSLEQCIQAIQWGFTDIMYDGSKTTLDENIEVTRQIAQAAHAVGAGLEAELGHVGSGDQYDTFGLLRKGFTDPDSVERFVHETGADFLAVAVGTAHGLYKGEPQLDLDLLGAISARVPIPLVLHGGTGLSEAQFTGAIARGIAKINVATDLYVHAACRLREAAVIEGINYFDLSRITVESFQVRCSYYLDVFGATGKSVL